VVSKRVSTLEDQRQADGVRTKNEIDRIVTVREHLTSRMQRIDDELSKVVRIIFLNPLGRIEPAITLKTI